MARRYQNSLHPLLKVRYFESVLDHLEKLISELPEIEAMKEAFREVDKTLKDSKIDARCRYFPTQL